MISAVSEICAISEVNKDLIPLSEWANLFLVVKIVGELKGVNESLEKNLKV
jgi:hypothetical protein